MSVNVGQETTDLRSVNGHREVEVFGLAAGPVPVARLLSSNDLLSSMSEKVVPTPALCSHRGILRCIAGRACATQLSMDAAKYP